MPYIASWSSEKADRPVVVARRQGGIAYPDEILHDRDEHGVLWSRTVLSPGRGRPEFGRIHTLRQRRAMRRLLCQICAGPADRTEQGVLWLLGDDREDWPNWPEMMAATHPPVCLPCARVAVRACPYLHGHAVAVRVREAPVEGVYGTLYAPGNPFPTPLRNETVTYDDPAIRWVCAGQLVRSLRGCTLVDIDAEPPADSRQ
ncbi:hypothetical protein RKE29_10115 [Streptomyces sp. B1866]|uniref:hypothetical protein n=1 Tax=Streptomyces sp. B1866 TaxID=3075431 RepID=UPI00288EEDCA|nr:hypothetical protein [Streptomyces sp. B1866]MDT3396997.1 hypothetical protein [Streptomyces sp. B1866]